MHEEAIEIQKQKFWFELEKLKEKLETMEFRSVALKEEVHLLKTSKTNTGKEASLKYLCKESYQ